VRVRDAAAMLDRAFYRWVFSDLVVLAPELTPVRVVGDPHEPSGHAVRGVADGDQWTEDDADPAARRQRPGRGDHAAPARARLQPGRQCRVELARSAHPRQVSLPVPLLELVLVARREEHDPEGLCDGDRVRTERPGDVRVVVDLDVRLPSALRHGEAAHAKDERRARGGRALDPRELGCLRRRRGGDHRLRPA
jgi:hypothetical protein